jgi:Kef-type K+ transport system membrane component KefB
MHNQDFFFQAFVFLAAAVVSVPIAKKLGLGSVLGYLLAGIVIGPYALKFIGSEDDNIMHFAEFGVVMMLFLIGLELKPSLLWKMRKSIFGLGGLQVLITAIVIALVAVIIQQPVNQAVSIGLILALSSTAIVLQSLSEKNLLKTPAGQSVFSVLLFQDIAVIPILAALPLLSTGQENITNAGHSDHVRVVQETFFQSGWGQLLLIIGLVLGIILVGRFVARHIFRFIAETGIREMFTATALFIVIAIAIGCIFLLN